MTNSAAAAGSAVFLLVAPGVVTGLAPWWITGWDPADAPAWWFPLRMLGAVLAVAGLVALLHAFGRFVVEGRGTPAPVAPTADLVVGGLYRYLRNPMYVAVLALIVGQALLLARPLLLVYAAAIAIAVVGFVRTYEEPTLRRQFGAEYEAYRAEMPGWWPQVSPRRAPRA